MTVMQKLALVAVGLLILLVLMKLWDYIRDGRCDECKSFGLKRDTRRYRAEDVFFLNTIIYCPKCGFVNEGWQDEVEGEH
jgi:RNase P subunit RPR2